jgi:methyltransferase (TIGR00027 family)
LAVGRFEDPTAMVLLRDDERTPVERARTKVRSRSWSRRIDVELLGRQAEAMAARTVAIDDAVREAGNPQLVLLGAGLDGRAWRMPELRSVDVYEVDHPVSQQDKRNRVAGLRAIAGSVRFVAVDLARGRLGAALARAGHLESSPTTWVLEGVIPYLTPSDAAATVAAVAGRSAPGSRMVVSYQIGSPRAALGRLVARTLLLVAGRGDPMAHEPRRSSWTPDSMRALLAGAGLNVTDDLDLATLARVLVVPTRHVRTSRVAIADWDQQ